MVTATTPPPPGHRDWPALAAAAQRLLADRQTRDPAAVERKRMTADHAASRLATARALALQWQCVADRRDAPDNGWDYFQTFGAYPITVRLDLADVARTAADRARANPDNLAMAMLAGTCAALRWWQTPHVEGDDMPSILRVHAANQQARREHAARPAPTPPPLPARPPLRAPAPQRALI